ncbi:MAG: tRNA 2-thiocytidine biosynthesis TtcA family protein [Selenomonadaceae bacterium]|nr:tRNA 2-thiocytidine biosynthesis TtcA family protein [Selenomonadaceae bacterium]
MELNLPQIIFSKVIRAVVEFELIDDGDKILIGMSGGKDSLLLAYALACLKQRTKKNFSLSALTIDPKFTDDFAEKISRAKKFCNDLNIPHEVHEVDIAALIREQGNGSPCFTCAYFRRAAMNRRANEIGANKIAYAHHLDDAVETFFMSLLSSGQLTTFQPKTFLDRTNITVIRPLVYLRESETETFAAEHSLNITKSPCPFDGSTNRQTVKNLIVELGKIFPDLFSHLATAMRKNSIGELWDAPKSRADMRAAYFALKGFDKKNKP